MHIEFVRMLRKRQNIRTLYIVTKILFENLSFCSIGISTFSLGGEISCMKCEKVNTAMVKGRLKPIASLRKHDLCNVTTCWVSFSILTMKVFVPKRVQCPNKTLEFSHQLPKIHLVHFSLTFVTFFPFSASN